MNVLLQTVEHAIEVLLLRVDVRESVLDLLLVFLDICHCVVERADLFAVLDDFAVPVRNLLGLLAEDLNVSFQLAVPLV